MKYSNKHIILAIIITVIILLYLIINIYHLLGIYVYFTYNMEGVILYIDEIADNIIRSNAVNEISLLQDTILYSQYGKIFTSSIASISSILLLIYSIRYQANKVKALMYVILLCVSVHLLNDLLCVIFTDYYSNHLYNINASLTDSQMSDIYALNKLYVKTRIFDIFFNILVIALWFFASKSLKVNFNRSLSH